MYNKLFLIIHFLVIKECYKAGFRWREVGFPVQPTFDAPPGFQLSSFHGERPIYRSDPGNTIPTGVVSNSGSTEPTYLPDWEPQPTLAAPFGLGPVPALQPIPPVVYRPAITSGSSTRVDTVVNTPAVGSSRPSSRPSQSGVAGPSVAGPSRILQARAPSTFVPLGVPGSARVNVNLVRTFTF